MSTENIMVEANDTWLTFESYQPKNGIDGIFENWEIIDVCINETTYRFLFGEIAIDYKGRFPKGKYVFSSLVSELDLINGLVSTRNSLYALVGDGNIFKATSIEAYNMKMSGLSLIAVREKMKEQA